MSRNVMFQIIDHSKRYHLCQKIMACIGNISYVCLVFVSLLWWLYFLLYVSQLLATIDCISHVVLMELWPF